MSLTTAQMFKRLGETFLRISRERIESGIGSSGDAMPPYSAAYAKKRGATGRDVAVRTLVFTGAMLAARRILSLDDDSVLVGFPDGTEEADKARGNEARTPFLKPTPDERDDLRELMRKLVVEKARQDIRDKIRGD